MKIKPYQNEVGELPAELGPAWLVIEGDRQVTHAITLAEALGLHKPEAEYDGGHHRVVALNHLRNHLLTTLADSVPADALHDGLSGEYAAADRNARLAIASFRKLCERPRHEWSPGLSPVETIIDATIGLARDSKRRLAGDRSQPDDRWWQIVITELEKVLAISQARLRG